MNQQQADQVMTEWYASCDRSLTAELQAVEAAVFLEDIFDITIPDKGIGEESLGDVAGMRAVLGRHLRER